MTPVPALTFAQFYDHVGRLLPTFSYKVEVNAWRHLHPGADDTRHVEFVVWVCEPMSKLFTGPTPESVLDALRHHVGPTLTPESVQLGDLEAITNPDGSR